MQFEGLLKKMKTEYKNPIRYFLDLRNDFLNLNFIIGKEIRIKHLYYECIHCKSNLIIYKQGYCKNCFFTLPETNLSILKPELSTAHLNIEQRNLKWEKKFELQPHIVYIAITSSPKIGVTQERQIFTRWMDQGAIQIIKIARTPNRYLAGIIEISLKEKISHTTNYINMVKNNYQKTDLIKLKNTLKQNIPKSLQNYFINEDNIIYFNYPVIYYPNVIQNLQLKTKKDFKKKLIGIKGQYLIFSDNSVINIRNHAGFYVKIYI